MKGSEADTHQSSSKAPWMDISHRNNTQSVQQGSHLHWRIHTKAQTRLEEDFFKSQPSLTEPLVNLMLRVNESGE